MRSLETLDAGNGGAASLPTSGLMLLCMVVASVAVITMVIFGCGHDDESVSGKPKRKFSKGPCPAVYYSGAADSGATGDSGHHHGGGCGGGGCGGGGCGGNNTA